MFKMQSIHIKEVDYTTSRIISQLSDLCLIMANIIYST